MVCMRERRSDKERGIGFSVPVMRQQKTFDRLRRDYFRLADNTRRNYVESAIVSVMGDISSVMRTSNSTVGFSTLAKS